MKTDIVYINLFTNKKLYYYMAILIYLQNGFKNNLFIHIKAFSHRHNTSI